MKRIVRIVGQRLLLKDAYVSSRRCYSTAAEKPAISVTRQPSRVTFLLDRVFRARADGNVSELLNEWTSQGRIFKRCDALVLVNHLRSRKDYDSALQVYDWMRSQEFDITNGDQAIIIDLLCKAKGMASAESYFNSLCDSEKTTKTYGSLLSCYCRVRDLDKALYIFEEMKKRNYKTTLNYNNMLSLFYSAALPERAVSLVQEMESSSVVPDGYTYNMLINCYAAVKNSDAIEAALEKMKRNYVGHTLFTYGNLATIYFNSGSVGKARAFLRKMEESKGSSKKELFESSRTLFKLYSEMNDEPGVVRTWESFKSAFPKTSNTGYLMMLLALSKLGNGKELEKIYSEWEERCSIFDFRLPNVLLEYYISREMIEEATSLYEKLVKRDEEPNLRSLNSFSVLCIKSGQIDLALKYLVTGLDKDGQGDHRWFPTTEAVNAFINYFQNSGDRESAEKFNNLVKRMRHVGLDL